MKRRTLPEHLYDFFAEDGYDGEERGPFDTLKEANKAKREWAKPYASYERPRLCVCWRLNEKKIHAALAAARKETP